MNRNERKQLGDLDDDVLEVIAEEKESKHTDTKEELLPIKPDLTKVEESINLVCKLNKKHTETM